MKLLLTLCLTLAFFSCEQSTSNTPKESLNSPIDIEVNQRRSSTTPTISGSTRPLAGRNYTYKLNVSSRISNVAGRWEVYRGSKRIKTGGTGKTQRFNFHRKYNGKRLTVKFKGSYDIIIKGNVVERNFTASKSIIVKIKGSGSV